jgi:stage V sporulation protein AC
MKMTNREYEEYIKKYENKSPLLKNLALAYLIGGLICVLGQALLNLYKSLGLDEETAPTAVSVTLVFLGALFTGLKLYDNLAKHAGAGTIVPITGFANAIVSPALEFKSEGFILGMSAKMFIVAGPVIVFGVVASAVYGVLLILFGR